MGKSGGKSASKSAGKLGAKSAKKRGARAPAAAAVQGAASVADVPAVAKVRVKKAEAKKAEAKRTQAKKTLAKKTLAKKTLAKKVSLPGKVLVKKALSRKKTLPKKALAKLASALRAPPPLAVGTSAAVLDRLWTVVEERRSADPTISHSARLLGRGTGKVAQKFGEEAVECLIEATSGTREGLIAESADVLYHLIVMWVNAGVRSDEVWHELQRREGVSGIAEKASRAKALPLELGLGTTKIP